MNSKKHVIKEKIQAFTMFNCWFCLKMHVLVSKLVALSVEKYMALTDIQLKICRFHGSHSQKGSRPLR